MALPKKLTVSVTLAALAASPALMGASPSAPALGDGASPTHSTSADQHSRDGGGDRDNRDRGERGKDTDKSKHKKKSVTVVAHRGASRVAPEETLAAYTTAIEQGADVLEGDVQLTKDGHMVLVHDDSLARTTNVDEVFPDRADARVGEFTLEEIKQLDAGSWFLPEFAGEKVPTVSEVLDLVDFKKVGVTLELKAAEHSPGVATKLAEELEERGLVDDSRTKSGEYQMMVHSRSQDALRELDEHLPDLPLTYLTGGPMLADEELEELSTWTMGVFSDPRRTTAADIERAHSFGLEAYNDPVDSPEQMNMAIGQGYDHLVTNVPDIATAVRDGRKDPEPNDNGVVIDHVVSNPSGEDMQYEHSEHITLRNTTSSPIDISGHSLTDNGGTRLYIRDGAVIQPGSLFRVYLGDGPNREDASYTNHHRGILNNTHGDSIVYFDADHEIVDSYSFILPAQ
jgi:glycerophosphoryl diester phosphodiesterase